MTIGNDGRDFLLHLLLLPVLEFLMTSPRVAGPSKKGKQRGVIVAATFLIGISAVKIGAELAFKEESLYDMMGVSPTTVGSELKKGFKTASLKVRSYNPEPFFFSMMSLSAHSVGSMRGAGASRQGGRRRGRRRRRRDRRGGRLHRAACRVRCPKRLLPT